MGVNNTLDSQSQVNFIHVAQNLKLALNDFTVFTGLNALYSDRDKLPPKKTLMWGKNFGLTTQKNSVDIICTPTSITQM